MSKVVNVRLREDVVKNYPNITNSSDNELLMVFLDIYKAVWNDFKCLTEDAQTEIINLAKNVKIKAGEGLRISPSRILNAIDAASPTTRLYFNDFHNNVGNTDI